MIRKHYTLLIASAVLGATACVAPGGDEAFFNEEGDVGLARAGLTKGSGGVNGDVDYCDDPANPCVSGEGDCDRNRDCLGTLVCVSDVGARFGLTPAADVCLAAHCKNRVQDADETDVDYGGACGEISEPNPNPPGSPDYCSTTYPCDYGEADCDTNGECQGSLVCVPGVGDRFGWSPSADVCLPAHCKNGVQDADETGVDVGGACGGMPLPPNPNPPGSPDYCSRDYPCASGEADCDGNQDCQPGLVCVARAGARFGWSASADVCLPAHCKNGVQDADEEGVDIGGSCGGMPLPPNPNPPGSPDYCTRDYLCAAGEGDCDGNQHCQTSLVCVARVGDRFGYSASTDVCLPGHCKNGVHDPSQGETAVDVGGPCGTPPAGPPGSENHCSVSTPCGQGGGDCDHDGECQSGLTCVDDLGAFYGYDPSVDVCVTDGSDPFPPQCDAVEWVRTESADTAADAVYRIATDSAGNIFAPVELAGTHQFGPVTVTEAQGAAVWSMTPDGTHRWVSARASGFVFVRGVGVDSSGRVYVTGLMANTVTFGGQAVTAQGSFDTFVWALSASGAHRWVRTGGGVDLDGGFGLAVDGSGNTYVAGSFKGAATFGSTTLNSTTDDAFVWSLNSNGTTRWARQAGASNTTRAYDVEVSPSGSQLVVTGGFSGNCSFGGGTARTSAGLADAYLWSLAPSSGAQLWNATAGGTADDGGWGLTFDDRGDIYLAGIFRGTATIGGGNFTSAGDRDAFLWKVSGAGANYWVSVAGGTSYEFGLDVAARDGSAYLVGYFASPTVTVGSLSLTSEGSADGMVLTADSDDGTWTCAGSFGGSNFDYGRGIAATSSGVFVSGYAGSADMDFGGTMVDADPQDGFVFRLAN